MTDVIAMVERAREKSLQMQARAEALAQLAASDAMPASEAGERIDVNVIEKRLAALKAESRPALEP